MVNEDNNHTSYECDYYEDNDDYDGDGDSDGDDYFVVVVSVGGG